MMKIAKSSDAIRAAIMAELGGILSCRGIEDVAIDVNEDRPPGLPNWWISRIRYQSSLPRSGIADSQNEVFQIEEVLRARYFVEPDEGFVLGQ